MALAVNRADFLEERTKSTDLLASVFVMSVLDVVNQCHERLDLPDSFLLRGSRVGFLKRL